MSFIRTSGSEWPIKGVQRAKPSGALSRGFLQRKPCPCRAGTPCGRNPQGCQDTHKTNERPTELIPQGAHFIGKGFYYDTDQNIGTTAPL